jgi:hypothetical protein
MVVLKYWKRFLYGSFMRPFPVFAFAPFRCFIFTKRESYIISFCLSCFRFHVSTFIVCALVLHRLNVQTPKHVVIASGLQVKLNLKKKRATDVRLIQISLCTFSLFFIHKARKLHNFILLFVFSLSCIYLYFFSFCLVEIKFPIP